MLRTRLTLKPGRSGTRDLVEQYGSKLVCVRYRYDDELGIRYKTVELIVDEKPWVPAGSRYKPTDMVHVRLHPPESRLREALKLLGGRYEPTTGTWLVAYAATTALRITARIEPDPKPSTSTTQHESPDSFSLRRDSYEDESAIRWRLGVGSK